MKPDTHLTAEHSSAWESCCIWRRGSTDTFTTFCRHIQLPLTVQQQLQRTCTEPRFPASIQGSAPQAQQVAAFLHSCFNLDQPLLTTFAGASTAKRLPSAAVGATASICKSLSLQLSSPGMLTLQLRARLQKPHTVPLWSFVRRSKALQRRTVRRAYG
jgi:hypothetical protein